MEHRTCKQCGKALTGKSSYCSGSCKTVYNRNKRNSNPEQTSAGTATVIDPEHICKVTVEPVISKEAIEPNAGYWQALGDDKNYATRTSPELLNWGPWMTSDELLEYKHRHSLKSYHNRVPIPGDHDYSGCGVSCQV